MIKYLPNQDIYMPELTYKLLDSVTKIEKAEWDLIFGDIPQGYAFFKTVEESKLQEFSFSYILIYEEGNILLIAPLFITDFNLDIAVSGITQKLIRGIRKLMPRFLMLKTLFCGSPISENGILGIRSEFKNKGALVDELLKIMELICKKNKISLIIFKDFLKASRAILKPLESEGFFMVESFPTVSVELRFNSLDDYFRSLSHNTRKNLRRKIKKASSAKNIEIKIVDNVEDIIEEIYTLYLNTYNAGSVRFEKLSKEFFINAGRNLPFQAKFFLYYVDSKLAAFNLCLAYKDLFIDEFIGFDYAIAYKYNLYFFSWCYNIKWCLENSIHYYQVGQTDYYPKLKLGGELIRLYVYIRHNNPVWNFFMRLLAFVFSPANFDKNINLDV